jgi:integrase
MDTNRPDDIRNRAIVMLFSVYGFRSSEVSGLRLEDIDWEHDQIMVRRPKQRLSQTYPLVPIVGDAIIRYLLDVRPKCSLREIFLTLRAPFRHISAGGLYHMTVTRMIALGVSSYRRGPHSLRHACAAHLISEGHSFKEIGDFLGHKSASATRIYAKVDMRGLREVADFDLGGVL